MPFLDTAGARLHYRREGNAAKPCLVLSNSLGTDLSMWDAQAEALAADYYVIRYDTRGHGESTIGAQPLDIARLGQDVIALLDHLGIARAAFCGLSLGGLTGQWLGVHAPQRLTHLVLADTAACIGSTAGWQERAQQVRLEGLAGVADATPARWFSPAFIERETATVTRMISRLREQDPAGYAACCDVLAHADLRQEVARIAVPTLVVVGEYDPVTTVADGAWLQQQIPYARLETVPASHIANVEAHLEFTALLRAFL
ncbi:MAG: 3-oxoadipate enol-lactonase [Paucibacter sp.]|nr:3-oxoadipate enol-lactonase [Roseateles sp.]